MSEIYSACPLVNTTTEVFVQHVEVGGAWQRMEFTREILWLQESESVIVWHHGGRALAMPSATHNDFYGYLSSMAMTSPSPADLARLYAVDTSSSLEIAVKTTVMLRPVMESPETRAFNASKPDNYKSRYVELPYDWRQEVTTDGEKTWPRVEAKVIGEAITWSSRMTPEENSQLQAAFRERWTQHDAVQHPTGRSQTTD